MLLPAGYCSASRRLSCRVVNREKLAKISNIGAIWDPFRPKHHYSKLEDPSRWNFENFFEVSPPYDTALTPRTWKTSFSETLDFRIQWIGAIPSLPPHDT